MNDMTAVLSDLKLRFNIDHPSFEECYALGYSAALEEIAEEHNPFNSASAEFEQWADGWWAGFYKETPLFTLVQAQEEDLAVFDEQASNDHNYFAIHASSFIATFLKITGAIAASALVGYQVLDLVA